MWHSVKQHHHAGSDPIFKDIRFLVCTTQRLIGSRSVSLIMLVSLLLFIIVHPHRPRSVSEPFPDAMTPILDWVNGLGIGCFNQMWINWYQNGHHYIGMWVYLFFVFICIFYSSSVFIIFSSPPRPRTTSDSWLPNRECEFWRHPYASISWMFGVYCILIILFPPSSFVIYSCSQTGRIVLDLPVKDHSVLIMGGNHSGYKDIWFTYRNFFSSVSPT